MISNPMEISYFFKDNSVVVISLYDNIYNEHLPQIKELFEEFISKKINNIILDLAKCLFIEKEIWKYLIDLEKDLSKNNGDLILSCIYGVVKNDYILMELSEQIKSFDDINNAFYHFGVLIDTKSA